MAALAYTEQIVTTSNTKLASVLVMFGGRLRKVLPLEWIDEWANKADFISWRKTQLPKPKTTVFYNFEPGSVDAGGIGAAFVSDFAEEEFTNLVNDSAIDEATRTKILSAHSKAVAANARETLAAREYLMGLMKAVPESAKWNQVRGPGKGQFARFGKQATKETIADFLSKI
jgi:hypothetical protein